MQVIKIGAVWCPGCLVMRPRWAEIEKENPWLVTRYFDYDHDKPEIEKYHLGDKLPVFIFLDDQDRELTRLTGEISKSQILATINKYKNN